MCIFYPLTFVHWQQHMIKWNPPSWVMRAEVEDVWTTGESKATCAFFLHLWNNRITTFTPQKAGEGNHDSLNFLGLLVHFLLVVRPLGLEVGDFKQDRARKSLCFGALFLLRIELEKLCETLNKCRKYILWTSWLTGATHSGTTLL